MGYLTFLPYLKKQPTFTLDSDGRGATIPLTITNANGTPTVLPSHSIRIRGAEDILGINPRIVSRHEPKPNTTDFESNNFPFLEFADPDFIFRYSPTVAGSVAQIKPWITLVVISQEEIDEMQAEGIEVLSKINEKRLALTIKVALLPPSTLIDLTGHVQLNDFEGNLSTHLNEKPSGSFCRLMCLRKLEPHKSYTGFLVPTFQSSVSTAFGLPTSDFQQQAWSSSSPDDVVKLPIYHRYNFRTSEFGDFEYHARKLVPVIASPDLIGKRAVDGDLLNAGARNPEQFFFREGVAVAPGFARESFYNLSRRLQYTEKLRDLLNKSIQPTVSEAAADPLITSPIYGVYFKKVNAFSLPAEDSSFDEPSWLQELNLDFRSRVMAAFGTRSIQLNKDAYLKTAWTQVGELREANEELRKSKAAMLIARSMKVKHLDNLNTERLVQMTSQFHDRLFVKNIGKSTTIKQALKNSGIAQGSFSSPFRKIVSVKATRAENKVLAPWSNVGKSLAKQQSTEGKPSFEGISEKFMARIQSQKISPTVKAKAAEKIPTEKVDLEYDLRPKINMDVAIRNRVKGIISLSSDKLTLSDDLEPIIASIHIDDPMYKPLRDQSPDYFIPGLEALGSNGVTMLVENRRMIEAYMASCNHQMMQTALFNALFINKRSTIFRYFWEAASTPQQTTDPLNPVESLPDVEHIHLWSNELGKNEAGGNVANLILCIKGDLIRRWPDTIIYTRKIEIETPAGDRHKFFSELNEAAQANFNENEIIEPIFRAQVSEDILCVGFPYDIHAVQGAQKQGEYYIILQENNDLPRLGLDVGTRAARQASFGNAADTTTTRDTSALNNLGWSNVVTDARGYITDFTSTDFKPGGLLDSSTVANACYQMPMRIVMHISHLLDKTLSNG